MFESRFRNEMRQVCSGESWDCYLGLVEVDIAVPIITTIYGVPRCSPHMLEYSSSDTCGSMPQLIKTADGVPVDTIIIY